MEPKKQFKKATAKAERGFTAEERAAMRDRAAEIKKEKRPGSKQDDGEAGVFAKIAEMPPPDRALAERLHALIKVAAPALAPRTWYGMPAYSKDGDTICFFQSSHRFKTRYATLGFSDKAKLDDGNLWPTGFALKNLTPEVEATVAALVKKAVR